MNAIVPGTGVMALGQPWLGLAIAVWFALGAELAACGVLIAPVTMPSFLMAGGFLFAGAAWVLAQVLLATRIRFLCDPGLPGELEILRQHAEAALARADHKAARSALLIALSIDDSDLPARVLWARLVTATASRARARRAWMGIARLDTEGRFTAEIQAALERL
jgi:hypothetical protein